MQTKSFCVGVVRQTWNIMVHHTKKNYIYYGSSALAGMDV